MRIYQLFKDSSAIPCIPRAATAAAGGRIEHMPRCQTGTPSSIRAAAHLRDASTEISLKRKLCANPGQLLGASSAHQPHCYSSALSISQISPPARRRGGSSRCVSLGRAAEPQGCTGCRSRQEGERKAELPLLKPLPCSCRDEERAEKMFRQLRLGRR